ncbi:MAG: chromate transporter [Thermovenabulum sp.]|uniref:chromate transporter n=1 Tax=Thermovenabulum sp. TaxID=3100335 RepID=UPI003C7A67AB
MIENIKLFYAFFKIGLFGFGGGYAMLPLIQKEVVEINRWLNFKEFMDVLAISQVTPGPISVNAATFVGYRVNGVLGSFSATLGVSMPSFVIILFLAYIIKKFSSKIKATDYFFQAIRPVVIALILQAAISIGKNSLTGFKELGIAAATFIGIYVLKIHPIAVIFFSAVMGVLLYH